MWKKMREFTERHIKLIAAVLVIAITALWLASQFIGELSDWMIKQNLLSVIIIVLLADNLARLVEIKREGAPTRVKVHGDDQCASADVTAFVQRNRPKKADLLEYSSDTIRGLLQNLRMADCDIRLLVEHPDTAITDFQRRRIRATLENVVNVTLRPSGTTTSPRSDAIGCLVHYGEGIWITRWSVWVGTLTGAIGLDFTGTITPSFVRAQTTKKAAACSKCSIARLSGCGTIKRQFLSRRFSKALSPARRGCNSFCRSLLLLFQTSEHLNFCRA